jgi:hypothetical protein
VEKGIKEMKDKKATGDDDVPEDILKMLGEDGLSIVIKLINKLYETGERPKDLLMIKYFPQIRS